MGTGIASLALATQLLVLAGCAVGEADVGATSSALTTVTWTNAVGVFVQGSDILKTFHLGEGWNAGASSVESIASGDGYMELTAPDNTEAMMVGLSHGDAHRGETDIDYALHLTAEGLVRISHNGVDQGASVGSYEPGDRFRIDVADGEIEYRRNSLLLYAALVSPTLPLVVDTSFFHVSAGLTEVVIEDRDAFAGWTDVEHVTTLDNSVTKSWPNPGWNAGPVSVESFDHDCYVEFTTGENDRAKMAGLGHASSSHGYQDIEFAFHLRADGTIRIYESGMLRGVFGAYAPGDAFRIEVVGTEVRYYHQGAPLHVSATPPTFPLAVDTSLYDDGATITDVWFHELLVFDHRRRVVVDGRSLSKPAGGLGWDSGATTTASLVSHGWVEFSTNESNTQKIGGLGHGNTSAGFEDVDFGWLLRDDGQLRIYEAGVKVPGNFGAYSAGDVFRVSSSGGTISFFQNALLRYTSPIPAQSPLVFDSSLYTPGASLVGVTLTNAPTFENLVDVVANGDDLVKSGSTGWNAGATTFGSFRGDGYVEFTTAEATTTKIAGLGGPNVDHRATDVELAFHLNQAGEVRIYESGAQVPGTFGSYAAGDVFRIAVEDGSVTYFHDGAAIYTSASAAPPQRFFDSSFHTDGATIRDVALVDITDCLAGEILIGTACETVTSLALRSGTSCAVVESGRQMCWGGSGPPLPITTPDGLPSLNSDPSDVVTLDIGLTHACALRSDGTVACRGGNNAGEIGDGTTQDAPTAVTVPLEPAVSVAVGFARFSCAAAEDGKVWCWGNNDHGQLGDGTIVQRESPVRALGLNGVVEVDAGTEHVCARRGTGTVVCWGQNAFGQLGDNTTTDRRSPVPVHGLADAVEIAVDGNTSCARRSDATAVCWGWNDRGQVGDGSTAQKRRTPVPVLGLANITQMMLGDAHGCAVHDGGLVSCWGRGLEGQLGQGTTMNAHAPVAVPGLTDVVEVAGGSRHTCARRSAGELLCWGDNLTGAIGDGTFVQRLTPTPVSF